MVVGAGDAEKDEKTGSLAPRTAGLKSFGVRTFHTLINWDPVRTFPWVDNLPSRPVAWEPLNLKDMILWSS